MFIAFVLFSLSFFLFITFQWVHFNMCHMCDSRSCQLHLHSCVQRSPAPSCLHHSSVICLPLFLFSSQLSFRHLSSSFFICFFTFSGHFSGLPSSTCSTTCAACVSARFRATPFLSEGVAPIVRDTLTWWGDEGSAWRWLLPHVSLVTESSSPQTKGYTNMSWLNSQWPDNNVLTSYRADCHKRFVSMAGRIFNPVTSNELLFLNLYCSPF